MPTSRVAVLDCGARHVALGLFARAGANTLRLEKFALVSFVLEPGREDEWLERFRAAVDVVRRRVDAHGPVSIVLPGHLVLTKFIKTPRVDATKREKVIHFEAQQNIPYALTEVVWDHGIVGETALDLEVMLCAAKLDAVEDLCAAVEAVGLVPSVLFPAALALQSAYRRANPETSVPTLLADVGARSTTLLLIANKRCHARTMALGGQNITQQVSENQDCEFADAEQLKLSAHHASLCAPAVENFANRLAQEITRSALHFRRHSAAATPARVLVTGGTSRTAGLGELLAARLQVAVLPFDPLEGVEVAPAANTEAAAHGPVLAGMVGAAALRLCGDQPMPNLLPPGLRRRETVRRRQPWLAAAAGLAATVLLAPLFHFRTLLAEQQHQIRAVEAEIAPLRQRESRNRANLERLDALQLQLGALQQIHERRANWQGLLADLQSRLVEVEDVWLERMHLAPSPDDSSAPLRLAVSGRMLDKTNPLSTVSPDTCLRVTTLLGSLGESPYVSSIEGERFDNHRPGMLHFDFVLVAAPTKPL
ncbi:MAG: pilus assembly protein PilM [Candidatus Didemnitutus sp.]|nr:pilus assembly protein PilM [Candidatus Didemnitutus sp.]